MAGNVNLKVDGVEMREHLATLDYSESMDRLDLFQAMLVLEAHGDRSEALTAVRAGKAFELTLRDGDDETIVEGDVVEVEHVRYAGGRYELRIVGLDPLHRLHYGQRVPTLWEAGHTDIVTEIANRNSLTPQVEGVDTTPGLEFQGDVSDGVFLHKLARTYNYFARVTGTDLIFGRRQGSGAITLQAGDTLQMNFKTSLRGIVTTVSAHGSDYQAGEAFVGTAAETDLQKSWGTGESGVAIAQAAYGEVAYIINQTGLNTSTGVTALAKAEIQARAEKFVQGRMLLPGRPLALAGKTLTIEGAAWPFTGTFLIRESRHTYSAKRGYRTHVMFGSDALPAES